MFTINYQIVKSYADEFLGQHVFFQLKVGKHSYGYIYPFDIANNLIPDEIIDWFDRMVDVLLKLRKEKYVALSDTESYNLWIEFVKLGSSVQISLRIMEKWGISGIFEYQLQNAMPGEWVDQKVSITQFEKEIIDKTHQYVQEVLSFSPECSAILSLKEKLSLCR